MLIFSQRDYNEMVFGNMSRKISHIRSNNFPKRLKHFGFLCIRSYRVDAAL